MLATNAPEIFTNPRRVKKESRRARTGPARHTPRGHTIDYMRELFPTIKEVSSETNPPRLDRARLERLSHMIQRFSVGVQSFDNTLLTRKGRYLVLVMMRQIFIGMNTERDRLRTLLPECERKMFTDSAEKQIAAAHAADEASES